MNRHIWEGRQVEDESQYEKTVMMCVICGAVDDGSHTDEECGYRRALSDRKAEGAEDQPRQKDPRAREPTPNRHEDPT